MTAEELERLAENNELLEVGRKAIEDELVEWRDSRLFVLGRGNGFAIREKDGSPSDVIRFGAETGLRIALKAIAKTLSEGANPCADSES